MCTSSQVIYDLISLRATAAGFIFKLQLYIKDKVIAIDTDPYTKMTALSCCSLVEKYLRDHGLNYINRSFVVRRCCRLELVPVCLNLPGHGMTTIILPGACM